MANDQHIQILLEGVDAWNKWRSENGDIKPDLSGEDGCYLDLSARLASAPLFSGKEKSTLKSGGRADETVDLSGIDLRGADLSWCYLRSTCFKGAQLDSAVLDHSGLDFVDFSYSSMSKTKMCEVSLIGANFVSANLEGANFRHSDIRGCDFDRANLARARFGGVVHRDLPRCRNIPEGYGELVENPKLIQYWRHQEWICCHIPHRTVSAKRKSDVLNDLINYSREVLPLFLVGGLLAGLIATDRVAIVLSASFFEHAISNMLVGAALAAGLGVFLNTYWGRKATHAFWGLLGFGWSWPRVALFGLGMVLLYGTLYSFVFIPGHHIAFVDPSVADVTAQLFYPWYVAAMGFSTLGVSGLAIPLTGIGQLVLISNVLLGFFVFGLLIATFANSFHGR